MDAILLCMKKRGIYFFKRIKFSNSDVVRFYAKWDFLKLLRSRRSKFDNVLIMAHGDNNSIVIPTSDLAAPKPYKRYIDCHDIDAFENNFVFAVSCLTANEFGKNCVEKGCVAYLGYQVEISHLFSADVISKNIIPTRVATNVNTLIKHIFIESLSTAYEEFLKQPISVEVLREHFAFNFEKQLSSLLGMNAREIFDKYNVKIREHHYTAFGTKMILEVLKILNEILPNLICIGDKNYISSSFINYRKRDNVPSDEIIQELESNTYFIHLKHEKYKCYLRDLATK